MTSVTPEDIEAASDLADLIDAQDPPRMFYVPDSEGFEAALGLLDSQYQATMWEELQRSLFPVPGPDGFLLPQRITITIPRHRSPSPADLQFVKACGERLRVRLAAAIPET